MSVYVLDSNFFIEAHRLHYPIDIAFGFWNKVRDLAELGKIISIDKVKNELYDNNDALEEWCRSNLPDTFFKKSSKILAEYIRVSNWAGSRSDHYLPNLLYS